MNENKYPLYDWTFSFSIFEETHTQPFSTQKCVFYAYSKLLSNDHVFAVSKIFLREVKIFYIEISKTKKSLLHRNCSTIV